MRRMLSGTITSRLNWAWTYICNQNDAYPFLHLGFPYFFLCFFFSKNYFINKSLPCEFWSQNHVLRRVIQCTNQILLSVAFGFSFLLQSTLPFSLGMWLPAVILCQPYVEVCSDTYFSNYLFASHSPLHRFWLFFIYFCYSVVCIFSNLALVIKVLTSTGTQ